MCGDVVALLIRILKQVTYYFAQRWAPPWIIHVAYGVAFACVGFLFSSHVMGNPPVDVYLHQMISLLCHGLAVIFAVEAFFPSNALISFLR